MGLILFVAELGSGFGHVRRLLPIARAAVDAGHAALFLVPNPGEVAGFVSASKFRLNAAPTLSAPPSAPPAPGAVPTSFADILGGIGFADADYLRRMTAQWDAVLSELCPLAIVSELSPFLNLACLGGQIPVLSVGHGFILPPPHLHRFPQLWPAPALYEEARLLANVTHVCAARGRSAPSALPALFAGSAHAVTGLEVLDPYRGERREPNFGPPGLELGSGLDAPSEDVFAYLLGDANITLTILRGLAQSGARGRAFVRRGTDAQRAALAGSGITWLDNPEPMSQALPRARLVVHHGSMLTAEESLLTGRAQLVAPLYLEHLLTARALSELGVAQVIRPADDAAEISARLATALGAEALGERARQFAEDYRKISASGAHLPAALLSAILPARESNALAPGQTEIAQSDAPRLSFVVPSYDMAPYLRLTLQSLLQLQAEPRLPFEIVVVDDGSSDDTQHVLSEMAKLLPQLRSVYRGRDARSCRALARNLGARSSRGRYIVFVDAGVLLHPRLLSALADRWSSAGAADDVVVLGTLGLFASPSTPSGQAPRSQFESLEPEALASAIEALSDQPEWCEQRQPWFAFTRGDLSQLPAPWLLAWSCALGLPRQSFDRAGGFDETFLTWGAEDCDFALSMHEAGARFYALAAPAALHVPHPTAAGETKKAEQRANARRVHVKRFGRESELFLVLEDPFAVNLVALRLDRAPLEQLLPHWPAPALRAAEALLAPQGDARGADLGAPNLIVGAPTPELVMQFTRAVWAVPSRQLAANIAQARGEGAVTCSLGCHTSELTRGKQSVLLTDLIRLLPPAVQRAQLREATRIGERAYLLCIAPGVASDRASIHRALAGWSLCPIDSLLSIANSAGVTLTPLASPVAWLRVFSLSCSHPA